MYEIGHLCFSCCHDQKKRCRDIQKGRISKCTDVLSRTIKQETGHTFKELLQEKRFEKASMFLRETDLPIADIMIACGYENSSYFYRKFKEKYEVSPKDYRKQYQ